MEGKRGKVAAVKVVGVNLEDGFSDSSGCGGNDCFREACSDHNKVIRCGFDWRV